MKEYEKGFKYIKLTHDNISEYINTIYAVMHDEDEIEKLRNNSLSSENFREWRKLTNNNKKLFQIIDMLHELAFLNSSE